jgi:Ca-activated chloride channel family protein
VGQFARRPVKAAAFVLLAALRLLAAEDQPSYRVDVQLVHILATVKDGNGQIVADLGKNDFQVFDNGAPQELKIFEHHSEQPLSIAVMIDTSASTGIELKYEVDSVSRFFHALFSEGNPRDAASLFSFNWETTLVTDYTHNLDWLEGGLRGIHSDGGTSLYDALCLAAATLDDREGRHVIIVVTDGGDTTSVRTFQDALKAAHLADVVLYPVLVIPVTNDPGRNTGGENALTTMAQATGGRVFQPTLGPALDAAFLEIIRDLRTQYLLAYYPKGVPLTSDPFHRVEVKVTRPGLRVSARSGYYGETEGSRDAKGWRRVK